MPICSSCGQENTEGARFCNACAAPLVAGPARETRKTVTVVFCDVTGSTALGERLDPESLRRVMARFFQAMREVIQRHGGSVEKFIGDAVMAVFGIPVAHEDDALRAVRAAAEMRGALAALNDELERDYATRIALRIGVNTGEVVTGTEERLATGDAVNVAARLEQAARPGEILIGEATLQLVRDALEVEPIRSLELRGKRKQVSAYRVAAVRAEGPGVARQLGAPMVGRERQLKALEDAFENVVVERTCHLVTILGPAGIGKSRLVAEFLRSVQATVVRGRCLSYGEGITYLPVVEIVERLLGDEPPTRLADLALDEAAASALRSLLGDDVAPASSEEIAWAVRKLFEAVAASEPLVVALDDIHWGEPTFLDLVEHVADLSRSAPILLVCLARPELLDLRPGWDDGKLNAIALEPLSVQETNELIEHLLGTRQLEEAVIARGREAADGNPLFVEEMMAMLCESGSGEVVVPPTIQALLAARLDQVDQPERSVLEKGAVEGKVFHRGAVQALAPGEPQIEAHLLALVRKELIRPERPTLPGEDAFRFRHQLIRDAAYDALPKRARAEAHERFADWLEEHKAQLPERDEIVGYHLEQASRFRTELNLRDERAGDLAARAGERLGSAGLRALARDDHMAAINLLSRALVLSPTESTLRLELMPSFGIALVNNGEWGRAFDILREAVERARTAGDARTQARAEAELVSVRLNSRRGTEGASKTEQKETLERAIPILERYDDEAGLARLWHRYSDVYFASCLFTERATALERSLFYARRASDTRQEAESLHWLADSLLRGPTPATEGIRLAGEMLAAAGGGGAVEASLLGPLGGFHAMQGRFDEARRLYREGRAIFDDLGLKFRAASRTMLGGMIEMLADDPAAAERELRWGCETLEAMGEKTELSTRLGLLADAIYAQGRYQEAERCTEASETLGFEEDIVTHVVWRATRAKILARRGEFELAENLAREAVGLAAATDSLNLHGGALLDLAAVLRLGGRPDQSVPAIDEAGLIYERKENVVAGGKARALLAEVGSLRRRRQSGGTRLQFERSA